MKVTPAMIQAARRGEFDYYQRNRLLGLERFISTPDEIIRAMLEAALGSVDSAEAPPQPEAPKPLRKSAIVTADKPKARR